MVGRPFQRGEDPRRGHGVPGKGRTPSQVRALYLEGAEAAYPILRQFVLDESLATGHRIAAAKVLAEVGLPYEPDPAAAPRPTGEELVAHLLELLPRVVAILPVDRQALGQALAHRRDLEARLGPPPVDPAR